MSKIVVTNTKDRCSEETRCNGRPSLCDDPKGWARVGEGAGFPMMPRTAT